MFRFDNPIYLWLLLWIPLSVIIYLYSLRKRKQRMDSFGSSALIQQLSPMTSQRRAWIKMVLVELALLLLILIIARPQIIALDISNSMLAMDVAPSRLERSKLLVEDLMTKFSDNKIGLIVFAGDAFVQLPITNDYVSAKMFLDNINPSLIGVQGTDIGKALRLSINSFTANSKVGKAIVLITDGEDNEGGAEEMAKQAQSKGIRVFILGVGSKEGATISMPDGSVLRSASGEVVRTRLNEEMCKKIAAAGHGLYLNVNNNSSADVVLSRELDKLQKGQINNVVYSDFDEQFQALALLVVILLIADVVLLERKRRW